MAKVFRLERVLVDTGIVYALADEDDGWHQRAVDFLSQYDGKLVLPSTVIPEASYLINKSFGVQAEIKFLLAFVNLEFSLESMTQDDLRRSLEILMSYKKVNIGFVDASLVAIAERLRITKLLTTDRRHFSAIQPKHCPHLELLP